MAADETMIMHKDISMENMYVNNADNAQEAGLAVGGFGAAQYGRTNVSCSRLCPMLRNESDWDEFVVFRTMHATAALHLNGCLCFDNRFHRGVDPCLAPHIRNTNDTLRMFSGTFTQ